MKQEDQRGVQKNTSLQAWGKFTEKYFGKKLRIEERKDREFIYTLLKEFGLPHERFYAFKSGDNISKDDFSKAVGDLGFPYWISATPRSGVKNLNRLSKLRIESTQEGWEFIRSLPRPSGYKIIVMQYANNPEFKGTAMVSKSLNGIADFVKGDRHPQLTSGLTLSDPMLFNSQKIIHYSDTISKEHQDLIYTYINDRPGHYEFQYGTLDRIRGISFLDYNDELAYEDIDLLFNDLVIYHTHKKITDMGDRDIVVRGLPASLGKVQGSCKIILSSNTQAYSEIKNGEILITDATNPDMTPLMKKVSAIVTDLGSVTCHAAIVCRELKIPCIVGTRNATSVLKEGTLLEVDAYKGLVRKLD